MKKIILIAAFFSFTCYFYPQNKQASKDGLIVLAGAGNMSGGLGIIAEYQIRIKLFTFISPFAGTGAELGAKDLIGVWQGYAIGAKIEHGKYHRVFAGLLYGTRGVGFENKNAEIINKHVLTGPSVIIGYKGFFYSGIVSFVNVGMAYVRNPLADNNKYYSGPTAGLGIGYKF